MRRALVQLRRTPPPRRPLSLLRVGGVPEHFNYPIRQAAANGGFAWSEHPGGSGAMAQKLREDELDVAILLTEAATLFAHKGDVTIVGSFVDTPLTWGVHALAGSEPSLDSRYAVSRMGSGSHLMALVAARQRGAPDPLFEVVGDLQGARIALKNKEADLFMWEKFTTKPLVDSGEWSRVAEVPTPWPCFAVVCTPEVARSRRDEVSEVLGSVYEKASRISSADIDAIAADYHLKSDDVAEWLAGVTWGPGVRMPSRVIDDCTRALLEAGVLEQGEVKSYREVVSDWTRDEPLDA
ncbi:unnamed protein product [Pelagomonas calceolata]|uniref:Ca3427-like PBP 2 domain-containing protein n=1 Tax=Pelagomonas calceolata TaxID=35677 RepID=A0A8J2X6M6_9STRA|nr:unnamed protein product [Pelagomonas calceolata]